MNEIHHSENGGFEDQKPTVSMTGFPVPMATYEGIVDNEPRDGDFGYGETTGDE